MRDLIVLRDRLPLLQRLNVEVPSPDHSWVGDVQVSHNAAKVLLDWPSLTCIEHTWYITISIIITINGY